MGASLAAAETKFRPRPDQREAINEVLNGFQNGADRGQLILPCGTGKTLTSLWIKEGMKNIGQEAKLTLKLVPSIALINLIPLNSLLLNLNSAEKLMDREIRANYTCV